MGNVLNSDDSIYILVDVQSLLLGSIHEFQYHLSQTTKLTPNDCEYVLRVHRRLSDAHYDIPLTKDAYEAFVEAIKKTMSDEERKE
jgi:hypothetical protein